MNHSWELWTGLGVVGAVFPGVFLAASVAVDLWVPYWYCLFSPPLVVVVPVLAAATAGIVGAVAYTGLGLLVSVLMAQFQDTLRMPGGVELPPGLHWSLLYGQLAALAVSLLASLVPGYLRSRRVKTVKRLRTVSEAVQQAVLVPVPEREGSVRASADYLAAADEALIGGAFYDILDTPFGVRMIMGDARGEGLPAVTSANALLGAFRAIAPYTPTLPELAKRLDGTVRRHKRRAGLDAGEFLTATLVSIPDGSPTQVLCCGHPGPLLVQSGNVTEMTATQPRSPLGLGNLAKDNSQPDTVSFNVGDYLLLFAGSFAEARDSSGICYPLADRVRAWARANPDAHPRRLVQHLVDDLKRYTGDVRSGDAAILVTQRIALDMRRLRTAEKAGDQLTSTSG